MTLVDPQSTMRKVLRPVDSFETLYQGVDADKPILLVPPDESGSFANAIAVGARERPELDSNLVRMAGVGRNTTLELLFPRCWSWNTISIPTFSTDYQYQVIWRIRQVRDNQLRPGTVHSLADRSTIPDNTTSPAARRIYLPAFAGPTIIPTLTTIDELPLVALATYGVFSQGVYDANNAGDKARQTVHYPLEQVAVKGDEFCLAVWRVNRGLGVWNFTSYDAPFANYFGSGGGNHPLYPHLGVRWDHTTALT